MHSNPQKQYGSAITPTSVSMPPPPPDDDGPRESPPDLTAASLAELATISGLHRNSVLNYKRRGIDPAGDPPWSLRDYYLLLRRHGKLGETKPTTKAAQALRSWAFSGGDSADPDDPAHAPPQCWPDEKARQEALKTMEVRKLQQVELETLKGERIPIANYRERWKRRAQQVLAALDIVMGIPKEVPDLPEHQRQRLVTACRQAITAIRARIAGNG